MIIKNPNQNVIAFNQLEWLIEDEPSPKKEVCSFLRGLYEKISGKKVKLAQDEEDKVKLAQDEEDEEDEEEEDEEDEEDEDFKTAFLDSTYKSFSLTEDGDVLLVADDADDDDLFLMNAHAKELLTKLKPKLEDRITKLSKLLR